MESNTDQSIFFGKKKYSLILLFNRIYIYINSIIYRMKKRIININFISSSLKDMQRELKFWKIVRIFNNSLDGYGWFIDAKINIDCKIYIVFAGIGWIEIFLLTILFQIDENVRLKNYYLFFRFVNYISSLSLSLSRFQHDIKYRAIVISKLIEN